MAEQDLIDFDKASDVFPDVARLNFEVGELNIDRVLGALPKEPSNGFKSDRQRHKWLFVGAPFDTPEVFDPPHTELMDLWPELRDLLARIPGRTIRAHISEIGPGDRLGMHKDGVTPVGGQKNGYEFFRRTLRFHVPLHTSKTCYLVVDGRFHHIPANEFWVFNNWRRHAAVNLDEDCVRTHLILDVMPEAELLQMTRSAEVMPGEERVDLLAEHWPGELA